MYESIMKMPLPIGEYVLFRKSPVRFKLGFQFVKPGELLLLPYERKQFYPHVLSVQIAGKTDYMRG